MYKSLTAIMAAAFAAATVTLMSAPGAQVTAGPMPEATRAPLQACAQRPWPYNNCVGTPYGTPNVRLVTTDRLDSRSPRPER